MKYLCLIYGDESRWPELPKADAERWTAEFKTFGESVRASGHFIGSNRLFPTGMARTVRVRDGRVSSTDGPFAETKEQLGGYYLIEAADIDEAVGIASRIPGARFGSVEVRPVADPA